MFDVVVIVPGMSWRVLFPPLSGHLPWRLCCLRSTILLKTILFNAAFHRIVQYDGPFVLRLLCSVFCCIFVLYIFHTKPYTERRQGLPVSYFLLCFCAQSISHQALTECRHGWAAAVWRAPSDAVGLGFPIFFLQKICWFHRKPAHSLSLIHI